MAQALSLILILLGSFGCVKMFVTEKSNSSCENFIGLTCKNNWPDRKYGMYDFVRQRLFYPEGLRPSDGYKLEQKILSQQTDMISNENSFQDNSMDDLKTFYKQCVGAKSIDFYKSPLISRILDVCGGPRIFKKNEIIHAELVKTMVDLQRTFGFGPILSLMMFDKITVAPLYFHDFEKSMMEQVLRDLQIEMNDQVNDVMEDILKFQQEHTNIDANNFKFESPKQMHSSDLKAALGNSSIDWYSFISQSMARDADEEFSIALNIEDIPVVDKVVSKFSKRTLLGYMFFATLVAFEASLDIRFFSQWPAPTEKVYSKQECLKFTSAAKLPFYVHYYRRYIDQNKQKTVQTSGQQIKSTLTSMVTKSKKIDNSTKSVLLEKLEKLQVVVEYGSVFKNDLLLQEYMNEMSLSQYTTMFEKYAVMLGKNFRFVMDLVRQGDPKNFIWFTDINLDHRLYTRLYASDEKTLVIKASMLEEPFFNESSNSNLQLIDWHFIEAMSALAAREILKSKQEKDIQNQENFVTCLGNETASQDSKIKRRLVSDNLFIDLALNVFNNNEEVTAQTRNPRLKDSVINYAKQFCGGLKAERFSNQKDIEKRMMRSMSNFESFNDVFECDEPPKECKIL